MVLPPKIIGGPLSHHQGMYICQTVFLIFPRFKWLLFSGNVILAAWYCAILFSFTHSNSFWDCVDLEYSAIKLLL